MANFGATPYRAMRERVLKGGITALPKSWQRSWMMQRLIATPPWADFREIRKIYQEAKRLTTETGVRWTVGHIVPLQHPRVCGLHVHWNLLPEPAKYNFSKGNAWCEWHGELFDQPEQLRLF